MSGSLTWSSQKGVDDGMTFRPAGETARDTIEWWNTLSEERRANPKTGLGAEREAEVLAAWHAREEAS